MHFRAWACTDWARVLAHYGQDGQDAEAVLGNSGVLLTWAGPVAERLATARYRGKGSPERAWTAP